MKEVVLFYNQFLPELKISINGERLNEFSSLTSLRYCRLDQWIDSLFEEIYAEVNSDYKMICVSNEFTCELIGEMSKWDKHCVSFTSRSLPISINIKERLHRLKELGAAETDKSMVIPVVNISSSDDMISTFFDVLNEQGVLDISTNCAARADYPLATIEIAHYNCADTFPNDVHAIFALCESEEDEINLNTNIPVYALVMGRETRFIKRQGSSLYFSIDPAEIGRVLLAIIEEGILCPLLSQLVYDLRATAEKRLLTMNEEDFMPLYQVAPICIVSLPDVCDVGRKVELHALIVPEGSEGALQVTTSSSEIIAVDGCELHPHNIGSAEIAVYFGDDPYPIAEKNICVIQRSLITAIKLFPTYPCVPVGGIKKMELSVEPENAENQDEIRWRTDNGGVATVDASTGDIMAIACGECNITAYTSETSATVSLRVQAKMKGINLQFQFLELSVGEQRECRCEIVPENAYGGKLLKFESSNERIATYRGGYVLGLGEGDCTIYITSRDSSIRRELRVSVTKKRKKKFR